MAMQKSMNLSEQGAQERVRLMTFDVPIIPIPPAQQQPVTDFQETPDTAPKPTTDMSQQVRSATVQLQLTDNNDQAPTYGSGTIVGISEDRKKILLSTGIHSFLNMLDVDPNASSSEDMIVRAKKKIQERLGQPFSNSPDKDTLQIPLKDSSGNQLNVMNAKFVAVNGPDGSEQILVEITLDKPLDKSFAPLAVATTKSTAIKQNSRILTGGYTPQDGYQESLSGRVISQELTSGLANEATKDGNGNIVDATKSDDKKYNNIFLVTDVPGIKRGTSGGTVATIDQNGKVVYIGTITAKNSENVGWISAITQDFVTKIDTWNKAN